MNAKVQSGYDGLYYKMEEEELVLLRQKAFDQVLLTNSLRFVGTCVDCDRTVGSAPPEGTLQFCNCCDTEMYGELDITNRSYRPVQKAFFSDENYLSKVCERYYRQSPREPELLIDISRSRFAQEVAANEAYSSDGLDSNIEFWLREDGVPFLVVRPGILDPCRRDEGPAEDSVLFAPTVVESETQDVMPSGTIWAIVSVLFLLAYAGGSMW